MGPDGAEKKIESIYQTALHIRCAVNQVNPL
jgi:hypothetical protein